MTGSHGTSTLHSRRLTTGGLIAITAATLLMMAWAIFPSSAVASTEVTTWTGNGNNNLPCTGGTTQWNLVGFGNLDPGDVTNVVLTVNGQPFNMTQNGNAFFAQVPGPGTNAQNTTASATWEWNGDGNAPTPTLTISHCTPGTPTTGTSSTTATTTSSTTATTTSTTPPGGTTTTPTTDTPTVSPTTVTPSETTDVPTVNPTTVQPGGTAFTGVEEVVPIGALALTLLTTGSGLLWAGARKRRNGTDDQS